MLVVQRMTPFYTERNEYHLRLVFAHQHFTIMKGEEIFYFIPSEGKEIVVNTKSFEVENLGEIFIFQRGERFIRLPLYQLLLISDLHMHLKTILEGGMDMNVKFGISENVRAIAKEVIEELEHENRLRMIDYALEAKDLALFKELTKVIQDNKTNETVK